jgi:ADP-heptose:LPS heptosyltransferase
MRIGILKPDHFGDLILSAPAIAALRRRFDDLVLLCHPQTVPLARHLFPGLALRPILFGHLDKTRTLSIHAQPLRDLRDAFDLLICLRWDRFMAPQVKKAGIPFHASYRDDFILHVAAEHYGVVAPLAGPYDPLSSYHYPNCSPPSARPTKLESVGLCISAGFGLNAWPLSYWLDLAVRLDRRGMRIVWVGGPAETTRLRILAESAAASLGYLAPTLVGGVDYAGFLSELEDAVDLVIATDSGTAHLAALSRPILSLFGGSPWQCYAPLGRCNAVLTRGMPCSPCRQFDRETINLCHSQECLTNLRPEQVEQGLDAYLAGEDFRPPRLIGGIWIAQAPWERQLPEESRLSSKRGELSQVSAPPAQGFAFAERRCIASTHGPEGGERVPDGTSAPDDLPLPDPLPRAWQASPLQRG